ncbi:gamma carbonic anhydrase family protein [Paracoccus versutus]|uniref:Carbonic anhydrase/acetyltransferase-like protein (Isoleucine patch superfamily) n=1 Tax=Paracoccus versutus TaxID=34007 RepID=A0AAQ0HGU7_PARVE|nr:gamma carbonic anhydrase family protein [Paracoccus versutus]KGJ08601.1 acetyltransferase [Paracoccus versutus]REG45920.1 carbonic anhydrase/acetyltransferase-like protein (isoleucine patch superfamily) [Paracoccus versutus]WEJ77637.1 gamma carbonic anhydrase family protein [Paracoccus versutus]
MSIYRLNDRQPRLPDGGDFWVAPTATVVGEVTIGPEVGIWFGAVLRGDNEPITVGARTNIQEHAMIHADPGFPARIGADVTIGHRAIVHGCTIGDGSLIGMGAMVLNGARIGRGCLIGAGTLVTEGTEIPDGSLVIGSPGKVVRTLNEAARQSLLQSAASYVANWRRFAAGLAET